MKQDHEQDNNHLPKVVVALITGGDRPDLLRSLMSTLANQRGRRELFDLAVVLVDNGAHQTVRRHDFPSELEVVVVHEATRGIPYARNRSVATAQVLGADYLAFIDDDERASEGWLSDSLVAMRTFGADGVAGRVEYDFARPVPTWQRLGGFYDSPTHDTGAALEFARTTNLVVEAKHVFQLGGGPFNVALRFSGGSDIEFTRRLADRGVRFVWSNEAVTHEYVPLDRCKASWAVKRAYRVGNNAGHRMSESRSLLGPIFALLAGVARLPYALGRLAIAAVRMDGAEVGNSVRIAIRGVGIATSPFHRYQEYI